MSAQPMRIKGHRWTGSTTNGVAIKPRCSCGWCGAAGNASQAKAAYREHKHAIAKDNGSPATIGG